MTDTNFPIDENETVVTSSYVTNDGMPILYVSHDEDDESETGGLWQFHCDNGDYSMEQMQLVSLKTILGLDPSVSSLANLPIGYGARRSAVGGEWTIAEE
jgi:hypothetical protein